MRKPSKDSQGTLTSCAIKTKYANTPVHFIGQTKKKTKQKNNNKQTNKKQLMFLIILDKNLFLLQ